MPKLTAKLIGDIRLPSKGQVIYRDDELTGFGLRVGKTGMSYIAEGRVKGQVQRKTIGRANLFSPEQARKQARRLLADMAAANKPKAGKVPTLAELIALYPTKKRLRESTLTNYQQVIRRYLSDWEHLPVTEITKEMVFARHRELGDRVSGNYANLIMQVLRIMLYFAMEHYETADGQPIILVNPVSKLSKNQMWYRKRRRQGVIPDHKLADWYRAVMVNASTNVRDYLLLIITTGLRRNEAATLKWTDVDLEARTLNIREEIAKNHREHKLPLSDFLFSLLSRRKIQSGDAEYVFPGRYGGHMVSYIRQINSKVAEQSNCPFMLHDLRRTFISMAAKLGVQHHLTKRLLNHIGDKDDTDEYIVISTEHLREPMEQISRRLLELMGADLSHWGIYPGYRANYRSITLQEAMDAYLSSRPLAKQSLRAYRQVITGRLTDWLSLPVTSITPEMVERRHHEISTVGTPWKASKVQANQTMNTLRAILNWVMDNYEVDGKPLIKANPVRVLRQNKSWHYIPPRERTLPDEKLADWYKAVMSLTATTPRDLLLVAMFAGLCHADVVNLKWIDVDLDAATLTVHSKHGRTHVLPLSDFLLRLFRRRKMMHGNDVYVFQGRAGGPIKQFCEVMQQAWDRSGIYFTVQDLRRTFLSIAERMDLPVYAVRALTNRSGRKSHSGRHEQFDIELLRKPMQQITNRLLQLMRAASSRKLVSKQKVRA